MMALVSGLKMSICSLFRVLLLSFYVFPIDIELAKGSRASPTSSSSNYASFVNTLSPVSNFRVCSPRLVHRSQGSATICPVPCGCVAGPILHRPTPASPLILGRGAQHQLSQGGYKHQRSDIHRVSPLNVTASPMVETRLPVLTSRVLPPSKSEAILRSLPSDRVIREQRKITSKTTCASSAGLHFAHHVNNAVGVPRIASISSTGSQFGSTDVSSYHRMSSRSLTPKGSCIITAEKIHNLASDASTVTDLLTPYPEDSGHIPVPQTSDALTSTSLGPARYLVLPVESNAENVDGREILNESLRQRTGGSCDRNTSSCPSLLSSNPPSNRFSRASSEEEQKKDSKNVYVAMRTNQLGLVPNIKPLPARLAPRSPASSQQWRSLTSSVRQVQTQTHEDAACSSSSSTESQEKVDTRRTAQQDTRTAHEVQQAVTKQMLSKADHKRFLEIMDEMTTMLRVMTTGMNRKIEDRFPSRDRSHASASSRSHQQIVEQESGESIIPGEKGQSLQEGRKVIDQQDLEQDDVDDFAEVADGKPFTRQMSCPETDIPPCSSATDIHPRQEDIISTQEKEKHEASSSSQDVDPDPHRVIFFPEIRSGRSSPCRNESRLAAHMDRLRARQALIRNEIFRVPKTTGGLARQDHAVMNNHESTQCRSSSSNERNLDEIFHCPPQSRSAQEPPCSSSDLLHSDVRDKVQDVTESADTSSQDQEAFLAALKTQVAELGLCVLGKINQDVSELNQQASQQADQEDELQAQAPKDVDRILSELCEEARVLQAEFKEILAQNQSPRRESEY